MAGRNVARAKMAGSTNIRGKICRKIGCSSSRLLRTRLPQSIIERYEMICILYSRFWFKLLELGTIHLPR